MLKAILSIIIVVVIPVFILIAIINPSLLNKIFPVKKSSESKNFPSYQGNFPPPGF